MQNIYLNISNPAGKDFDATTVLTEIQETFAFNSPEVVHPVYWVDPVGGTDSTAAKNTPRNAFKTLAYALQSSRVTNGATVMLMPGLHTNSTSFTVAINANARPGSATNTTFIQGYGEGTSFLELDTANTSSQITLDDTSGNITIRDLDVYTKSPTALPLFNTSGYTKTLTYDGTRADYNRWK